MLATVQWACISNEAANDDDDDDDDIMIMSHCADICPTLTDCGSCLSAGAQCVWSVLKQQVCLLQLIKKGKCSVEEEEDSAQT